MTGPADWAGRVVGLDLDMTLVDTSAAVAACLTRVNRELGVQVDVAACVQTLGAPQRDQLARWVPAGLLDEAMRLLAAAFLTDGLPLARPCPGAARLLTELHDGGGRAVVVTARRTALAAACLRRCGLSGPALAGGLPPAGKSQALRQHRVQCYVGDHPLDMAAAVTAGVTAIGVTTGFHDRNQLAAAGAALVLPSLAGLHPAALAGAGRAAAAGARPD
jgi:phosphoglycolate phosphatase-like HAD superfamily hydrolase